MRVFLLMFGVALVAVGACIYFVLAKSAIHEIEGAIVALGGITSFVGGAIVGAIEDRK